MKQLLFFISVFLLINSANAQLVKNKFTVNGKCGMCKKTIETAALRSGVKSASWDKDKQVLDVEYDSMAVEITKVKKAIADAGYDADGFSASAEVYNALPDCCKYRSSNTPECSGKGKCKTDKKCRKGRDKACCVKKDGEKCEKDAAACCKKGEAGKSKKCCKE